MWRITFPWNGMLAGKMVGIENRFDEENVFECRRQTLCVSRRVEPRTHPQTRRSGLSKDRQGRRLRDSARPVQCAPTTLTLKCCQCGFRNLITRSRRYHNRLRTILEYAFTKSASYHPIEKASQKIIYFKF